MEPQTARVARLYHDIHESTRTLDHYEKEPLVNNPAARIAYNICNKIDKLRRITTDEEREALGSEIEWQERKARDFLQKVRSI